MVDLAVVLRVDPTEPQLGAGPTVYGHVDGQTPIIATSNIDALDPIRVGEVIVALMRGHLIERAGGLP